jgi:hypothetical protein
MSISTRFVLAQGPVLRAMAGTAFAALQQGKAPRVDAAARTASEGPGPTFSAELKPRPRALLDAYVRHVGGDPSGYRGVVVPHFFPQWVFPLAAKTLEGVPYPLLSVLNGGSRLEINAPLPADEPLLVEGRLEGIDDNGSRAVLHQRFVTGTRSSPNALVTHLYAVVPLAKKKTSPGNGDAPRAKPSISPFAREIAYGRIRADAGLDFAKLTGDFNPIHWVPAYARKARFPNVILHGFSTFARTFEAVRRGVFLGDASKITAFDAKFTKPVVLPANMGVYVEGNRVFAGTGRGGAVFLEGRFESPLSVTPFAYPELRHSSEVHPAHSNPAQGAP